MATLATTPASQPVTAQKRSTTGAGDFNAAAHGLRGVASMMVFFAHLLGGTAKHIYQAHPSYGDAVLPFWNVGTFGVELFFVISGFVIIPSVKRYSLGQFGLRRFLRLYPLFFVFTVLFVVLNAVTGDYPRRGGALAIVSGLTFTNLFTGTKQLTPNAWSLSFEVMFYLGAALIWHFAGPRRNPLLLLIVSGLALAFWISFPIVTYFAMGVLVRIAHDRGWFVRPNIAWLLELLLFGLMVALASTGHYEYGAEDMAKPVVPPLIGSTALYFYMAIHPGSLTSKLLSNRPVQYLGTISYSLYIVHPYIYLPMRLFFDRLGLFTLDTVSSMALFFAAVTPPMLVATIIVHKWLELRPYTWFFGQAIYRRAKPANGANGADGERGQRTKKSQTAAVASNTSEPGPEIARR